MPVSILAKVGRRVCYMREEREVTQEVLSAQAGISRQTLSRIENGKVDPGIETLHNIAKALRLKMSDLLGGVD